MSSKELITCGAIVVSCLFLLSFFISLCNCAGELCQGPTGVWYAKPTIVSTEGCKSEDLKDLPYTHLRGRWLDIGRYDKKRVCGVHDIEDYILGDDNCSVHYKEQLETTEEHYRGLVTLKLMWPFRPTCVVTAHIAFRKP